MYSGSHVAAELASYLEEGLGDLAEGADADGVHEFGEYVAVGEGGLLEALEGLGSLVFVPFLKFVESAEL